MTAVTNCELELTTHSRRSSQRRHHPLCSGSGPSRPRPELTVSATLRSSRRLIRLDVDGWFQGTAVFARRRRSATQAYGGMLSTVG
jgi:hypothetical protein